MTIMLKFVCFFNDEGCEMFTDLILKKRERMYLNCDDVMSLFLILMLVYRLVLVIGLSSFM